MKNINNETKEFFDNLQISKQRKKEIYEEITKKTPEKSLLAKKKCLVVLYYC